MTSVEGGHSTHVSLYYSIAYDEALVKTEYHRPPHAMRPSEHMGVPVPIR